MYKGVVGMEIRSGLTDIRFFICKTVAACYICVFLRPDFLSFPMVNYPVSLLLKCWLAVLLCCSPVFGFAQEGPAVPRNRTDIDRLIDSASQLKGRPMNEVVPLLQLIGQYSDKLDYPKGLVVSSLELARLYHARRNFSKAEAFATEGLEFAERAQMTSYKKAFSLLLSEIAFDRENLPPDTSLVEEARDMVATIKYKSYVMDTLRKSAQRAEDLQRDVQHKEDELVVFRLQSVLLAMGLIGLVAVGVLGLLWMRKRRAKLEQRQQLTEQKLKRSQMNPHFIFNSLQNVRSLIHSNREEEAVEYLNRFSKLTRQVLESSDENYISLAEEVEMLQHYLSIQQLLYGNSFDFSVTVTEGIDTDAFFVPPMLAQPFVENAVKHGVAGRKQGGRIVVRFFLHGKRLFFEVCDNGQGFSASTRKEGHKSMAIAITRERLSHYNKSTRFRFQTGDVLDAQQQVTGARVVFEVPFVYDF